MLKLNQLLCSLAFLTPCMVHSVPIDLSLATMQTTQQSGPQLAELLKRIDVIENRLNESANKSGGSNEFKDGPTEAGIDTTLSEYERNAAYAWGQLMAIDALNAIANIPLDHAQLTQGFMDGVQQKARMEKTELSSIQQQLVRKFRENIEKQEVVARTRIGEITQGKNILEKNDNNVWIEHAKGQKPIAEKAPLNVTYKVAVVGGDEFENVSNKKVVNDNTHPNILRKGIKLAAMGGKVEMYALAGSIGEDYPLPSTIRTYDIIHFIIEVSASETAPDEPELKKTS